MKDSEDIWRKKIQLFRKRFASREDVFNVKQYNNAYGKDEKSYWLPQCMNFGNQNVCLISKNQGGCSSCDHKVYAKLTDEWIWKHISGQEELALFLLTKDGIKFGACDFDRGDPFEDALAIKKLSASYGLPAYIARSSKKGYHVYWFFSQNIEAYLFTSFIRYCYFKLGFYQRSQENQNIPIPEVFPKQITYSENHIGNAIKVPMIQPKFSEGYNCFVDDSAVPYKAEDQWKILDSCIEITPEQFSKVVEAENVEVIKAPARQSKLEAKVYSGSGNEPVGAAQLRESKPSGDFNNVVNGCPALKQFWEKDAEGAYKFEKDNPGPNGVPHVARLASLLIARRTENGLDMVQERWNTNKTKGAIEQANAMKYTPMSCKRMQETGVCKVNVHPKHKDHCFKKTPPSQLVNGKVVYNPDNLPESEWPDPSPVRLAHSKTMSYDDLVTQVDELFARDKSQVSNFDEELARVYRSIIDSGEQGKIDQHILTKKYLGKRELSALAKRTVQAAKHEQLEEVKKRSRHYVFGKSTYILDEDNNRYLIHTKDAKGNFEERELTNFTVEIKEELETLANIDEDTDNSRHVEQRACLFVIKTSKGNVSQLRISTEELFKSADSFFNKLMTAAGTNLHCMTSDYNHVKICINEFSQETKRIKKAIRQIGHHTYKGQNYYMMPSVMVTRDGIQPNTEFDIKFTDDICGPLDFKILEEAEFKDLALHIINDYFKCSSQLATMTTFAHAMAAAIMPQLPHSKSPILFLMGDMGTGKSFVAQAAQCLYGNFASVASSTSTGKARLEQASRFRNALFLVDDFKTNLSDFGGKEMIQFIQMTYDRSARNALKRDGEMRNPSRARGLVCITGEDVPRNEASALSRMLIVDVPKGKNEEAGKRVLERRVEYGGFTPHLIQYVYNLEPESIKEMFSSYYTAFDSEIKKQYPNESTQRVSENLSMNMTAFALTMDMLVARGVLVQENRDALVAQHYTNLEIIRHTVLSLVSQQKGSEVFVQSLRELIQDPRHHHIKNWPGLTLSDSEVGNSTPIGHWKAETPEVVYIYPNKACGAIKDMISKGDQGWLQSQQHIGRQLVSNGHIPNGMWDSSSPHCAKQVVGPSGNKVSTWVIYVKALGLEPPKPLPSQSAKPAFKVPSELEGL